MGIRQYKPRHKTATTYHRTLNPKLEYRALYNSANWITYREKFSAINNRCYACGEPTTVVDHLVPHKGDEKLFTQRDNHIPLCTTCHNKVTGLFDRRHRPGNPATPKIRWLNYQRSLKGLTFKVKVMPTYP